MKNTLVFVDKKAAIEVATHIVGSTLSSTATQGGGGAFNWLIQARIDFDEGWSISTIIRDLPKEQIIYEIYEHMDQSLKFPSVASCVKKLADTSEKRLTPGQLISVEGKLTFPELAQLPKFDPFDPPEIMVKTFNVHGEKCFVGELRDENFRLPIYFEVKAKDQVGFLNNEPVEVSAIIRWSPPYSPGGASALNLILRGVAVWLR